MNIPLGRVRLGYAIPILGDLTRDANGPAVDAFAGVRPLQVRVPAPGELVTYRILRGMLPEEEDSREM